MNIHSWYVFGNTKARRACLRFSREPHAHARRPSITYSSFPLTARVHVLKQGKNQEAVLQSNMYVVFNKLFEHDFTCGVICDHNFRKFLIA